MQTIQQFLRLIPNEAIFIVSSSGCVLDMSNGARCICDLFGEERIKPSLARCLGEFDSEVMYRGLSPQSHKVSLGRSKVHLRFTSHSLPALSGSRLVVVERCLRYEDLLDQFETVLFMCENIPRGIALHVLDPITGNNWYRFSSKLYAELSGCTVETLEQQGVMAVGNLVPPEDNRRSTETILNAARKFGDCTITPRIFRNGVYKYTRFYGRARGVIENSVVAEDFTERAQDMNKVNIYKCANYMLSSFARAVFDVCFYTDSKFRIIDDNPKLRYFFAIERNASLMNTPLEAFMRLDEDKQRFRDYVAQRLEIQATSDPEKVALQPAATMIALRLALVGDSLCGVQLYATPTYLHAMEGFGSSHGADGTTGLNMPRIVLDSESLQRGCMYLVGIRVVESNPRDFTSSEVPVIQQKSPIERSQLRKIRTMTSRSPTLPHVPEDCYVPEIVSSSSSEAGSLAVPASGSPMKQLYVTSQLRCITRDIHASFSKLFRPSSCESGKSIGSGMTWIIPLYEISDRAVVLEEMMMILPYNLRCDFLRASQASDYLQCSQILGLSDDGNFDLLNQNLSRAKLTNNVDSLQNSFRHFLGLVPGLDSDRGVQLLSLLGRTLTRIQESICSRIVPNILRFQYTLALLSYASKHPDSFRVDPMMGWLRMCFRDTIRECGSNLRQKSRSTPVMYYMCFLWGGLMIILDRSDEATAVWGNLRDDMDNYDQLHPCVSSVNELQGLVFYNLGLALITKGNLEDGFSLVYRLRTFVNENLIRDIPPEYDELIGWAQEFQIRAQLNAYLGKDSSYV